MLVILSLWSYIGALVQSRGKRKIDGRKKKKKTLKDQKKIVYTKNNCDMNIITAKH
jgi:hypothetical protein